jgi:phenylacetate-CoA ligase
MIATAEALKPKSLDTWAAQRIGVAPPRLTPEAIAEYQLRGIQKTVAWARHKSSYYAARLVALPAAWPRSFDEFTHTPLTSPADIVERGHEFLCVPQSEISRVVTFESSGTSGLRKRVFFTAEDQELALDFFKHGVAAMSAAGDRMVIALPGEREGSVGFQLARGIARAGVVAIPYGMIFEPNAALAFMDREKATLLIGLPVQILAIALESGEIARRVFHRLKTVVLCSDYVAKSVVQRIRKATGCDIFEHYGSTEMGLGGGVDCNAHVGYHLREADLYFEIVSPTRGEPLCDGQMGDVVFTTLGRAGMPLIRFRTGDLARIIPGRCPCGSPLRRMERVGNRVDSRVALGSEGSITIAELDEILFAIPGVNDFAAVLVIGRPNELQVQVYASDLFDRIAAEVERTLMLLPAIGANCNGGELRVIVHLQGQPFPVTGAKRKIGVQSVI